MWRLIGGALRERKLRKGMLVYFVRNRFYGRKYTHTVSQTQFQFFGRNDREIFEISKFRKYLEREVLEPMIGRWSSNALLRYIRKQVEQFSHNVSSRMLKFEMHNHLPGVEPRISHMDPRQRNHRDNAETRRNIGGDLSRRVQLPSFSLFN